MQDAPENQPPPPPPRTVPLGPCLAMGKTKGILFSVFLVLGIVLALLFAKIGRGLPPGPDARLDERHAVVETGRLLRRPYPSKDRVNGRRPLVLEFAFRLPGGRTVKGYSYTFSLSRAQKALVLSGRIPVEYDPERPELARIEGTRLTYFPSLLFLLPASFLVLSLVMGVVWITSALRLQSLANFGTACKARVLEIRPVTGINPPPWRVTWKLEDPPPGVPAEGSAWIPRSHPFARTHGPGDPIWVVCDEFSGRAFPWIFREKTTDPFQEALAGGTR